MSTLRRRAVLFLVAAVAAAGFGVATAQPAGAIACTATGGGMICMDGLKIIVCDSAGCGSGILDM